MGKYDPIHTHLLALETQHLSLDFSEIDSMVGALIDVERLPAQAPDG